SDYRDLHSFPTRRSSDLGTADWDLPLSHGFSLSGEFYRGLAVGGLGGGIGRSVIFSGPAYAPGTQVNGLDSVGGWSQLKFRPTRSEEHTSELQSRSDLVC